MGPTSGSALNWIENYAGANTKGLSVWEQFEFKKEGLSYRPLDGQDGSSGIKWA